MGMKVGGAKSAPMGDINVTPLVDVVLVLLIIFMVVTPMLSSGVDVELPESKSSTEAQDKGQHLVVSISKDKEIFVETEASSMENLVVDINTAYAQDGNRALLIKGDKILKWKDVHQVLNEINENGMNTMLLATENPEGS